MLFFAAVLLAGCATRKDDARLQGMWRSNGDATVAAAFERDPRWKNAPPEKVQRFKDLFGKLTISYADGVATAQGIGETFSFHYQVVEHGADYVVIRDDSPEDAGRDIKIRFVDGDAGYWVNTGPLGRGLQERFDRVGTMSNPEPSQDFRESNREKN